MLKNLVYLSTFTLIIIFSWVAFGIYNAWVTSTINKETQVLITPIPSSFDLDVVDSLSKRDTIAVDLSQSKTSSSESAQIAPPVTITPPAAQSQAPSQIASSSANPIILGPTIPPALIPTSALNPPFPSILPTQASGGQGL